MECWSERVFKRKNINGGLMEVWTGFLVGLFGSLHCVGMCGPIALALPAFGNTRFKIVLGRILYNLGRIVTYSIMGMLFGLFGSRLVLYGFQQDLSIALGTAIIIYLLVPRRIKAKFTDTFIYKKIISFIRTNYGALTSKRSINSLFTIGLLNGLLPCGFVYVGIAGATSTGDWITGSIYMALFGLGTFPIMFATSMLGKVINVNIRQRITRLIPVLTAVIALLFILRGLNLGIPYLSPKFHHPTNKTEQPLPECCH